MKPLNLTEQLATAHRHIDQASKDQLAGLLHALLDREEQLTDEILALILRGVRPPTPAGRSSMGMVNSTATLADLAQGMLYREREGKRRWMRIVEIGPVVNLDSSGAAARREAVTHPAFSHEVVKERPTLIYGYETPFEVRVPEGSPIA
jgi:hypothetical protein